MTHPNWSEHLATRSWRRVRYSPQKLASSTSSRPGASMRMRPTRQLVKFWRALVTPKRVRTSGKGEIKCNNTFAQRRGTVYLIEQRHSRSEPRSVLDEGFQPRGKIGVQLLALDEAQDVPHKNVRLAAGNGGGAGCSSDSRLDR